MVDDNGRPYCTRHAEEGSPQFRRAAGDYKAGLRERALRAGLDLSKDALAARSGPVSFFHEEWSSQSDLPSSPVLAKLDREGPARTWMPWLLVGANLGKLLQGASADAARGYATETGSALERAGIPSFNARIINEKLERMARADNEQERQRLCNDIIEAIADSARRMDMAAERQDKKLAFGFGSVFCAVLMYAALRQGATIDPYQFWLFRVVAAMAAAGVAAMVPGFINVNMNFGTKFAIRAGGAVAVFLIIYQLNPPDLVSKSSPVAPATAHPSATAPTPGTAPLPGSASSSSTPRDAQP